MVDTFFSLTCSIFLKSGVILGKPTDEEMTKVFGFCLALLCCICEARTGYAQPGDASDVLDAYLAAYGQTLLYQGKQYVRTTSGTLGHQSHFTNAMTEGCTVRFDGVDFQDVPLMYDLELNELVTRHPERPVNLILSRAFVSRFTIGADTFVQVKDESKGLVPGYYQQLFHAPTFSAYAKRSKTIQVSTTERARQYIEHVRFFLMRSDDTGFWTVGSQRALLNAFRPQKRELRRLLNRHGLSFRHAPEQTIVFVLNHVTE